MSSTKRVARNIILSVLGSASATACSSPDSEDNISVQAGSGTGQEPVVEAVRITDQALAQLADDPVAAAVAYVRTFDAELGLSDLDDFALIQVHTGRNQQLHVRLAQTHQGLPVWGSDIVVHTDGSRFFGLNGTVAKNLGSLAVTPVVAATRALEIGKADYAARGRGGSSLAYARESVELAVFPRQGRDARVAWHVAFFTELQAGLEPGLWHYLVDATTGAILHSYNGLDALQQASGLGGNPKVGRTWVADLDVEPLDGVFVMETARLRTRSLNGGIFGPGSIVFGPLGSIGDAAINDAHGFAEKTLDMLADWYGYDSIDGNGLVIRSRVHYDVGFENAFWDGTQVTYGDGGATLYPLSGALDVVAHEIHHGFTEFHSNLRSESQSGALSESFSDIAGTLAEFFYEGAAADFDIGRDIMKGNTALRSLCDPPADGTSVDHFDDYVEGMNANAASGIPNKAFCLAARRFASGSPNGTATQASVRRVGEAFYEANASFWTATATFEQGCEGVMAAAEVLGFSEAERELLNQSWQDVGVFCDGAVEPIECDETLTANTGTITSPNFPASYPNNFDRTYCIRPASGNTATLTFNSFETERGFDFVRIRDGNGAILSTTSGTTPPAPASSTFLAVTFRSDAELPARGWSASWTANRPCADGTHSAPGLPITIPDNNSTGIRSIIHVPEGGVLQGLLSLSLRIDHTWRGDLRVTLISPSGTSRVVHNQTGGSANNVVITDLALATFHGEPVTGNWTLLVQDLVAQDRGTLRDWSISVNTDCEGSSWSGAATPNRSLVDNGSACTSLTVQGTGDAADAVLEIDGEHSWRAALRATLQHGGRTVAAFPARTFSTGAGRFRLSNRAVPGLTGSAAGTWTLCIVDVDGFFDFGTLFSWSVHD